MGQYLQVLQEIHMRPKHFQSDFCRYNSAFIAEASSRGHISCLINGITKGKWFITTLGLELLTKYEIEV